MQKLKYLKHFLHQVLIYFNRILTTKQNVQ